MKNNKEIKFRAWDEISGKWLIWDYYDNTKSGSCFWDIAYGMPINQFTGLKDKNGKEIYEGDIVKVVYPDELDKEMMEDDSDYIGEVVFEDGMYMLKKNNIFMDSLEQESQSHTFEVIGNIYENPNLLTK